MQSHVAFYVATASSTYVLALQVHDGLGAFILDLLEQELDELLQAIGNWFEQRIQVLQVFSLIVADHVFALGVEEGLVIRNHTLLALLLKFLNRAQVHELMRTDVLLVEDPDDFLHVLTNRAGLKQLRGLRCEILARSFEHLPLKFFFVKLQVALLLVILDHDETVNVAVYCFDVFRGQVALDAVALYSLQNLFDKKVAQILDHQRPPYVKAELSNLHLLLGNG